MADDKEWSENPEDDPIELQKRQLELGKKFLAKMEAQEAAEKERQAAYAQAPRQAVVSAYKPPTPEEVSETFKKAWEQTKAIMPDAPECVQLQTFQALVQAYAPPYPSAFVG